MNYSVVNMMMVNAEHFHVIENRMFFGNADSWLLALFIKYWKSKNTCLFIFVNVWYEMKTASQ